MTRRCEHCDRWVSTDWQRVMGGEDGCYACPACATNRQLHHGAAADPERRKQHARPQPASREEVLVR